MQPEPVNHLNNDLELQELITIHRSSSSNINFAVNLARRFFTSNDLKDNRTWFVGHRRRGGADVHGQLDLVRLDIPDLFKQVEWKKCCKVIDASGRELLRKERVVAQLH